MQNRKLNRIVYLLCSCTSQCNNPIKNLPGPRLFFLLSIYHIFPSAPSKSPGCDEGMNLLFSLRPLFPSFFQNGIDSCRTCCKTSYQIYPPFVHCRLNTSLDYPFIQISVINRLFLLWNVYKRILWLMYCVYHINLSLSFIFVSNMYHGHPYSSRKTQSETLHRYPDITISVRATSKNKIHKIRILESRYQIMADPLHFWKLERMQESAEYLWYDDKERHRNW